MRNFSSDRIYYFAADEHNGGTPRDGRVCIVHGIRNVRCTGVQ